MATLKSIRTRIGSVKNTQKITRAMKMVAAAKLRRAQDAVVAARPYATELARVIEQIQQKGTNHPLFASNKTREKKKARYLIFTSNKGLCGGFNSNLLRKIETHLTKTANQFEQIDVNIIGRKGRDYFQSRKKTFHDFYPELADNFPFTKAQEMANQMVQAYLKEECDAYFIVYNQFKSALTQVVTIESFLPFELKKNEGEETEALHQIEPIFEPSKAKILDSLIPKYLASQLYRAHLESQASELGSRMTAMESATKNASEMIRKLNLVYNRARQAAITTELMDIVNGAESMK